MEIVNSLARQMQGSHHRLSRATACSSSGAILMIQGHDHEVSCAIADWATTSNELCQIASMLSTGCHDKPMPPACWLP